MTYSQLRDLHIAKELLKIEFSEEPISEWEIMYNYKRLFNLSQEEIDAIMNEINGTKKDDTTYQFDLFGQTQIGSKIPEKKDKCLFHEWVKYQGLNECFEFCKICDVKRK